MDSQKRNIMIALMVAMFIGAVEGTVVTTAVPTIVKDLHGFEIISMVFSVYFLASAISTPIYGKLSDLFGRKNILSIGIMIFLLGSISCGLSTTIYMLIVFRTVQGLGAGAIFTVSYTIVGDVFTLEERPRVQGGIGTVWGGASLIGPFLGGFLIDTLSWHWIFFINVPIGIISVIILQKSLTEIFEKKKHKIDFAGTFTLSIAMIILLNIFLSNKNMGLNHNLFVSISIVTTFVLLGAFYIIERKASEPVIPFDIFTKTSVIVNIICFFASAALVGLDVYMPIYIQNILGFNAMVSGLVMAPMSIAWLMSSVILGKFIVKLGGKTIVLISNAILLISAILLTFLNINSSLLLVIIFTFIMGFGFGGAFTTLTIIIQSSVEYNKRGAATATNSLLKTLGQTIAVSIFGGVFNLYVVKYFNKIGIKGIDTGNLYTASSTNLGVTSGQIRLSQNNSTHYLFVILLLISIVCLILTVAIPRSREKQYGQKT